MFDAKSMIAATGIFLASTMPAMAGTLSEKSDYKIAPQSLEGALLEFSSVSGVQVVAASDLLANKRSAGVSARLTAEGALEALLADTGLTFRPNGTNTVAIVPVGKSGLASGSAMDRQIIVTAQKREQTLLEAPLSVTALRGEDLENRGQRGVNDFIDTVPGVSVRPTSNGFATIQIRGISSGVGDGTVGIYLDEIPFSVLSTTVSPNLRSFDLDRVEVLRGPQGTLYGLGSMGGTVKLVTKAPDLNRYEVKAEASGGIKTGGDADYLGNLAVNIPLVEDKLAVRLVGSYQKSGGYLDDRTTGEADVNDFTARNYRAKVLFSPNPDLRVTASAWFQRDVSNFSNGGFDDGTLISGPGRDMLKVNSDAYNATVEYSLGFADLTSSTSYMKFNYTSNNFTLTETPAYTSTVDVFSAVDNNIFAQEIRLVSSDSGPVKWSFGGLYTDIDLDSAADVDVLTQVPDLVSVGTLQQIAGGIDSEAWAVFGEVSAELFGGVVEPLIGLRYFRDRRDGFADTYVQSSYDYVPDMIPDSVEEISSYEEVTGTFDSLNPRFNIAFHLADDWLSYVNVAKGFRSGGGNDAAGVALAASLGLDDADTYDSDSVWSYELGTKVEALDGRLGIEAAIYYNDWDGIQLMPTDTATGISFITNGGTAHSKGVELSIDYRPIPGLELVASGNLNESELDEVDPALLGFLPYKDGGRLDFVPEFQVNSSATYKWSLGGTGGLTGTLYGAFSYSAPQYRTSTDGIFKGDDITTVNLRASIDDDNWGAFVYVDNLFNEDGRVNSFVDGTGTRLQPRVIGVGLRGRFN